jgi:hypothetical protein
VALVSFLGRCCLLGWLVFWAHEAALTYSSGLTLDKQDWDFYVAQLDFHGRRSRWLWLLVGGDLVGSGSKNGRRKKDNEKHTVFSYFDMPFLRLLAFSRKSNVFF